MKFTGSGNRQLIYRYGAAVVAVAIVSFVRWWLEPWLGPLGVITLYFPALIIVAFYGGLGPGLLATALSGAAIALFYGVSPPSWNTTPWVDAFRLALFMLSGILLSLLGQALHETRRRGERAVEEMRLRGAERALQTSEAKARSVLESAVDGIITIDERGIIASANPAAERLFQYRASELIGQNVNILMPSPYREQHNSYIANYLRTGQKKIIGIGREVVGQRKDGSVFPMDLAVSEAIIDGGRLFTGLVRDISDRKRYEEQLRQAKEEAEKARHQTEAAGRMKDEFLATLSHELRTPLNAMLGWAKLLQTGDLDRETTEQALDAIERNARMQSQLVEDLLDVSRIISGRLRLDMREVNMVAVIDAAIQSVKPAAEAKGIHLTQSIDKPIYSLWGDPTRLQQVVWNLLSNAIKFTPRNGHVRIALQEIESHLQVVVSDTGRGISPDFLPHVFDRFSQADTSSTRTHGGLGLGLAIVRHMVELHGGTIEAHSEGQNKGATFLVQLPITAVKSEIPAARMQIAEVEAAGFECPLSLADIRVLVVDDEPDACQLIKTILQRCHAQVTIANSAAEAMQLLPQLRPHVLVSDIGMPQEDGNSMIRRIRALPEAQGGKTPAIALTAFAKVEDRIKALTSGFQMHIPKPADPTELVIAIGSVTGRTASQEMH